ncbi:MAG: hypothetical protein ACQETI_06990 [Halobacteriota archaeon]
MRRYGPLVVAVVLLVATVSPALVVATPPSAGVPAATDVSTRSAAEAAVNGSAATVNESSTGNESVLPGEQFAGVVGVQQAEVDGELAERSFGIAVSKAATNDSKAAVVSGQLRTAEARLVALREQKADLTAAYENGTLREGAYRARMAALAARISTTKRLVEGSDAVASELPAESLNASGVDASDIRRLKTEADQLSGPEVAAVAHSVAGPDVGRGLNDSDDAAEDERGRPDDVPGRDDDATEGSDDGDRPGRTDVVPGTDGDGSDGDSDDDAFRRGAGNGEIGVVVGNGSDASDDDDVVDDSDAGDDESEDDGGDSDAAIDGADADRGNAHDRGSADGRTTADGGRDDVRVGNDVGDESPSTADDDATNGSVGTESSLVPVAG